MTADRDLKAIIRARMSKTGESYTTARMQLVGAPSTTPVPPPTASPLQAVPMLAEVAVLKVNELSARVRILGSEEQITFRATGACELIPGMIARLTMRKRWSYRGFEYASGDIEDARIDIPALGLAPIPVTVDGESDGRSEYEPYRPRDPYYPLWKRITGKPKPELEFDEVAWRGSGEEESPVCDASEMINRGEVDEAKDLLMKVLCQDLRCIDAHVHLGNLILDRYPKGALRHYEVGVLLGEHALPRDLDAYIPWGMLYNRPFLRALHGYGLAHWRLGRLKEAKQIFERILKLNPNDNQGVRFCWMDVRSGLSWDEASKHGACADDQQDLTLN